MNDKIFGLPTRQNTKTKADIKPYAADNFKPNKDGGGGSVGLGVGCEGVDVGTGVGTLVGMAEGRLVGTRVGRLEEGRLVGELVSPGRVGRDVAGA